MFRANPEKSKPTTWSKFWSMRLTATMTMKRIRIFSRCHNLRLLQRALYTIYTILDTVELAISHQSNMPRILPPPRLKTLSPQSRANNAGAGSPIATIPAKGKPSTATPSETTISKEYVHPPHIPLARSLQPVKAYRIPFQPV